MDSIEKSRKLSESLSLSFPVLADPDLDVIRKYGVADEENGIAWPAVFIIKRDGRVGWRSLSETYKKRPLSVELLSHLDEESGTSPR